MQRTQAPAQGLRRVAPAWDACAPIFVRQLQALGLICLVMTRLLAPSNAIPTACGRVSLAAHYLAFCQSAAKDLAKP